MRDLLFGSSRGLGEPLRGDVSTHSGFRVSDAKADGKGPSTTKTEPLPKPLP